MSMTRDITVYLNGKKHTLGVRENTTLLTAIREGFHLKGTKEVCGIGECGACTVLRDGVPVSSCIELAVRADGTHIETIEGLAKDGQLHPLQRAFVQNSAFQCGFCTAGMIMMGKSFLERGRSRREPSEKEIRDYMSGNLCRCTGYQQIVDAIKQAAKEMA
jgi:aerobic carbon-monoxide dehydrogenase small subunit